MYSKQKGFISLGTILLIIGVVFLLVLAAKKASNSNDAATKQASSEHSESEEKNMSGNNSLDFFYFDGNSTGNYEIYSSDNGNTKQLTNSYEHDSWWPRISPDKTKLLFYRTPRGTHDTDYSKTSLWILDTKTQTTKELITSNANGWDVHGHAEWSPDSNKLVMFAGNRINPQIHISDTNGDNILQITNEGGQNLDPSWSPDGNSIVYIACPESICFPKDQEVYTVNSNGGERTRLTSDNLRDNDPYYSPDGSQIALLTQTKEPGNTQIAGEWETRKIKDGIVTSITNFKNVLSLPSWYDNTTIYTHGIEYGRTSGFDLFRIDSETGSVSTLSQTANDQEYISISR